MQTLPSSSLLLLTVGLAAGAEPFPLVAVPGEPALKAPERVSMQVAAETKEQGVTSPTALTFDESGALYVAETHRFLDGVEDARGHLYWYLDDLAARTTADRKAMHEKWKAKVPLEKLTAKSESIQRLVDRDGDGKFEDSGVFAEGFNDLLDGTAAGVLALDGTVYFASIPKIWALRDTNQDGKADEKQALHDGFGVHVSFSGHDLNGFVLGPDGRLYGTLGDRGMNVATPEGRKLELTNQGAVIRFEPDGSGLEIVHTGLRNPKELAFDAWGNAFTVDNNSDQGDKARLVYIAEGADSGWEMEHQAMSSFHQQIGLAELPPNRWMVERMWEPANRDQPAYLLPPVANVTAGPSGLTFHPGTGFLESEAGRFVVCDYRGTSARSGLWSFKAEPQGAGMKLVDSRRLVWGIAATDVEFSWDGKLFVTDFEGGWVAHDDGRVVAFDAGESTWRAGQAAETARLIREGFDQRPEAELGTLLKHADQRVRLRAQLALTRKAGGLKGFAQAVASSDPMERVHGIWGLGVIARRGAALRPPSVESGTTVPDREKQTEAIQLLLPLLKHVDAEVRAQTWKVLGEAGPMEATLPWEKGWADPSARVKYFAAIAAGKLGARAALPAIQKVIEANAGQDPYLFHAGVFALERLVREPKELLALTRESSPPVRLAAVVVLRRARAPEVAAFVRDADPRVSHEAIRAIHDASIEAVRPAVAELLDQPASASLKPFMLRRLIHSAFRLGGEVNARRLIAVSQSAKMPADVRLEALRLLTLWDQPPPADQSTGHLMTLQKRDAAELLPLLQAAMPVWLKARGDVLTGVMELTRHYRLGPESISDGALRELIAQASAPGEARATALTVLADRKPADLGQLLAQAAATHDAQLGLKALNLLVERFPAVATIPLMKAAESKETALAQAAWRNLAKVDDPAVVPVFLRALEALKSKQGVSPVALELLAAARERKEPALKEALAAYDAMVSATTDPLVASLPSLEGGDARKGAGLFQSHPASECRRCHRAEVGGDSGGEAGPNLAGVAKRGNRRFLLESLVNPSAKIAPGFGIVSLTLKNDTSLGGLLLKETPEFVDLEVEGKAVRVKRADLKSMTPAVSAMPPMAHALKPDELRDLVAWLATKSEKPVAPKQAVTPPVLDPKTLLKK